MGTWGTGIYSNDISSDVVEDCKIIYSVLPPEEANRKILEQYKMILDYDEDDNSVADFWFALVNWQWEHGVLPDENKNVVLKMIENQCGIQMWIDEGNLLDIKKRKGVLNKLYAKLNTHQPAVNIPKLKLRKPKHKIGDIIIFKTIDWCKDEYKDLWIIENLSLPNYFKLSSDCFLSNLTTMLDAHNKYLAVICVGYEKEAYSNLFENLYHENSVYAFYDYCSVEKPTVEQLSLCGFLPNVNISYSDFNRGIVDKLDWTYTFVTVDSFRSNKSHIETFEKINCMEEEKRFSRLLKAKNYSGDSIGCFTLQDAYEAFFEEKLRFGSLNIPIDNLLGRDEKNPELLTPKEYNSQLK